MGEKKKKDNRTPNDPNQQLPLLLPRTHVKNVSPVKERWYKAGIHQPNTQTHIKLVQGWYSLRSLVPMTLVQGGYYLRSLVPTKLVPVQGWYCLIGSYYTSLVGSLRPVFDSRCKSRYNTRQILVGTLTQHTKQRLCHTVALPFTYLKTKEELWKPKYSPCKYIIFKKSCRRNQNPSRYYNSITNLKFQHKPKYHLSKCLI
jgi:hypothetical protein